MKLGIIGSGMIVNDLLSFIESIENIELVAILGREKSREKIEKIVNQHHIKKAYYDYNELLNDSQIDLRNTCLLYSLSFTCTNCNYFSHKIIPFINSSMVY